MRLAALADIHGNADALAAVLADLSGQGADGVVVLGDHFSGPLAAAETWDLLQGLDARSLRGNHDRYLVEVPRARMGLSDAAAYDDLPRAALDWLAGLPPSLHLDGVFACHGTPDRDDVYLCEEVTPGGQVAERAPAGITQSLDGIAAGLILCAHSHLPRALRLPDGRQVVNPGSVGCPAYADDTPVPHVVSCGFVQASYAVLTRDGGNWAVDLRRVAYDSARMVARARDAARDEWAQGLATGRIGP